MYNVKLHLAFDISYLRRNGKNSDELQIKSGEFENDEAIFTYVISNEKKKKNSLLFTTAKGVCYFNGGSNSRSSTIRDKFEEYFDTNRHFLNMRFKRFNTNI